MVQKGSSAMTTGLFAVEVRDGIVRTQDELDRVGTAPAMPRAGTTSRFGQVE
jgi:hypothetical protein